MATVLTQHEIFAFPAGQLLNAWVAHLVFGWSDEGPSLVRHGKAWTPAPPNYSGDVAAAWLVVEKLTGAGWGSFGFDGFAHGRQWLAGFGHQAATADTFPLAVCRAALLVVAAQRATSPGPSA